MKNNAFCFRSPAPRLAVSLCLLIGFHFLPQLRAEPAEKPVAVPTFECIGLYWKVPGAAASVCEASYRAAGTKDWKQAMPLWFDSRNQEYRGSIVHLQPGTSYEVSLQLRGTSSRAFFQARTWSEAFPVAKKVNGRAHSNKTLTITESGSPEGLVLYEPAGTATSMIDVAGESDHCIVVKASYVILRGLVLKGARVHAILLEDGAHDVVIENCDISGWGRIAEDGWGKDYDAAIYSKDPSIKRIIIQRNRIHHPRSNSNNWQQARPGPGKREPTHPEGPQAVCLWDSEGNHVIRYNTVFSDDEHAYNDVFGAGHNFSTRGFPNRDSDIYGNLLSHCWDDAIESEGANCNVRIWGNYITEAYVGVACASTSIGPLYVWRNVTGVIRESPTKISGAFFKTGGQMGGGRIYVFHNTILQPASASDPNRTSGAVVGLGWGGPMTNVVSRNNLLHVTRQAIADRAHDPLGDYDYDLFTAPLAAGPNQEKHGLRGVPVYVSGVGLKEGRGIFALAAQSPGFDSGVVLPNFNDDFSGSAPDIGAHEPGSPPMEFGTEAYRQSTKQEDRSTLSGQTRGLKVDAPYPPSPTLESIVWHWETYTTAAPGSDLWPITWGPDDHLYAAWGDGGGFGGSDSDGRVAMGFARIEGGRERWRGINVNGGKSPEHPASFAQKGKTTGIAFVDGILYATVNQEDGPWPDVNHVLVWSTNNGATWSRADWLFPKGEGNFQPAKFLSFGRDYTGVPASLDGYVYIYGPRQSADRGSGNRLYLARAPRNRLRQRAAYEYYQRVNAAGAPVWTADSAQAQPVFTDPNGVTPGAVVFDPGLKRFLLACFHVGPGQLGVFDAPNPWGPWTTIAYYEDWGQMGTGGEGLTCDFPQKWMSPDGLTLWSIFSVYGDGAKSGIHAHDKFNLVKVSLQPRGKL